MNIKNIFNNKKKVVGKCKCGKNVYEDRLFVEKDGKVYHYSCFNNDK